MAARRGTGTRAETIHCDVCGEDYAVTYKRCPFCNGRPPAEDGEELEERRGGGKRLTSNTRGGGYGGGPSPLKIIGTVVSLAVIVAAVCIVISIVKPLIDKGNVAPVDPDSPPTTSVAPGQDPAPGETTPADPAATPGIEPTDPAVTVPAEQTATGFTLDKSDFTMNDSYPNPVTIKVTFTPAGTTGTVTWTSSNPEAVSVDEKGTVSPGGKTGSATITASLPGAPDQTCTVRNSVTSAAPPSSGGGSSSGGALSLNREDFTLESPGQSFTVRVSGTSSTPAWSIGNSSVATVGADGKVTAVSKGVTTLTCTVDGRTLECIVRCVW